MVRVRLVSLLSVRVRLVSFRVVRVRLLSFMVIFGEVRCWGYVRVR